MTIQEDILEQFKATGLSASELARRVVMAGRANNVQTVFNFLNGMNSTLETVQGIKDTLDEIGKEPDKQA